jgi:protoporphyrinogen oxidase
MVEVQNLIIGAGLTGLSCSYHIGHNNCLILEAKPYPYGHIYSEIIDNFTWDEGPHVSFTNHDYVKELFDESVNGEYEEYEVTTGNYFRGHWIEHPAQSNLYQIPEPLRSQCLESFLNSRKDLNEKAIPQNYGEWLHLAFGKVFAENFPYAYSRKYWTVDPIELTTDWVGSRVFYPSVEDVLKGSKGPLGRKTHYIKKVRYPSRGGYQAFAQKLFNGANIELNADVCNIDLDKKILQTSKGKTFHYQKLVNTMPLPGFVNICESVPKIVQEASEALLCSSIQLVNVTAQHETLRSENWMYVYDEEKYSVRINCTEKLSPVNAPVGHTGVQVEVYHSRNKPLKESSKVIEKRVVQELIEMGLICPKKAGGRAKIKSMSRFVKWANVIFHYDTKPALDIILNWLESKGLTREPDDLHPITDWTMKQELINENLVLAGRFGQWKYYWTDDCVMRGKQLAEEIL